VNFARSYLLTLPSVTDLVGENIFPLHVPQGFDKPCIVYQVVDVTRQVTYSGTNKLVQAFVQFDCLAKRYADAQQIAAVVREALTDYSGEMAGTAVRGCFLTAEQDLSDIEPGFFRVSLNFNLWYVET